MAELPPGPTAPPLAQQLAWIAAPTRLLTHCARRFGATFTLRTATQPPTIIVTEPAAIREIFTGDPEVFRAGDAARILEPVLGSGSVLLLDGARHARERKLLLPPFHGERLRAHAAVMQETARRILAGWPLGRPAPIHTAMQRITLEVILRSVFGFRPGPDMDAMCALLSRWANRGSSLFGTALLFLLPTTPGSSPLRRALGLVSMREAPASGLDTTRVLPWRRLVDDNRAVEAALREQIARRRAAPAGDDVLSLLLAARDEDGRGLSEDDLRDELLTMLVAGHETTATALTWAIHHLLDHPDALARARAEAAASDDPLAERPWIEAVTRETLRLTPVVPMTARYLARPARIGGRDLPAGVVVAPCIWLTHRRADLWPAPERFDPARFLGVKADPYAYLPFGGGARRCLGMGFAALEMRVVLAEVLRRLQLQRAPGAPPRPMRRGVTLAPSGGVTVIATLQ